MTHQTRRHLQSLADKDGFLYRKNRKRPTLKIYEDGSIVRADTDLTLCRDLTVTEAYKALGIRN